MPISPSDRALGDLLVARRILSLAQFDEAVHLVERWNVRLTDAVLARAWVAPDELYRGIACHFDLAFVDLLAKPPDPALLRCDEADFYARRLMLPWRQRDDRIVVATAEPGPETALLARQRWGTAVDFVVVSKFSLVWALQEAFDTSLPGQACFESGARAPAVAARTPFTLEQVAGACALLSTLVVGLLLAPLATLIALNVLMGVVHVGNIAFKGVLMSLAGAASRAGDASIACAAQALREDELLVFTVFVPIVREVHVLARLAEALRALDYPLGKLDIKIVLDAQDQAGIAAVRSLGLEGAFELIRLPTSTHGTGPRALSFALRFARGEYLVIDAQDRPEPDQLCKVVATFRQAGNRTACLQGRLSTCGEGQTWLGRLLRLDQDQWFGPLLPGLDRLRSPVPLAGTSTHFKTEILRELHGWEALNVTPESDLDMRFVDKGYQVGVVDSATFAEAGGGVEEWIRQRARWIGGYLRSLLLHANRPRHLMRDAGLLGGLGFVFIIGGAVLAVILNPLLWLLCLGSLAALNFGAEPLLPGAVLILTLVNLLAGQIAVVLPGLVAPNRRRWLDLLPHGLALLGYWAIIAPAGYRALWRQIHPSLKEKAKRVVSHRLDSSIAPPRGAWS